MNDTVSVSHREITYLIAFVDVLSGFDYGIVCPV